MNPGPEASVTRELVNTALTNDKLCNTAASAGSPALSFFTCTPSLIVITVHNKPATADQLLPLHQDMQKVVIAIRWQSRASGNEIAVKWSDGYCICCLSCRLFLGDSSRHVSKYY